MGVVLRKKKLTKPGHFSLYLDTITGGRRKREFLDLHLVGDRMQDKDTWKAAKNIRRQREMQSFDMRHPGASTDGRSRNFMEYAQVSVRTKREKTRSVTRSALRYFEACFGNDLTLAQIGRSEIRKLHEYLLAQPKLERNTARLYMARVIAALSSAVKDGLISANPGTGLRITPEKKHPISLDLAEVRKLVATSCPNAQVRNAFLLSCATGLRGGDIRRLKFSDIRDQHIVIVIEKTGELFSLPLSTQAMVILAEQRALRAEDAELVFKLPNSNQLNPILRVWAKAAEVNKSIHMHTARHSFARIYLSIPGANLYTLSKLLGHSSIATTQIYGSLAEGMKDQAVGTLPSFTEDR